MTRPITAMLLTLAGFLALTASSEASINGREHRQRQRIREGVQSGQLTNREAARLAREQATIRREEHLYRANDGRLGPRERADLRRDLRRSSHDVYRQKHDDQTK